MEAEEVEEFRWNQRVYILGSYGVEGIIVDGPFYPEAGSEPHYAVRHDWSNYEKTYPPHASAWRAYKRIIVDEQANEAVACRPFPGERYVVSPHGSWLRSGTRAAIQNCCLTALFSRGILVV